MNISKPLEISDISGEDFSRRIFEDSQYASKFIEFDRIQLTKDQKTWILFDHILIQDDVSQVVELPESERKRIQNLLEFKDFIKIKSGKNVKLFIDLYFGLDTPKANNVLLMKQDQSFISLNISQLSFIFRKLNREEKFLMEDVYLIEHNELKRKDDTPFSMSKSLLCGDETLGFNIDKIIFDKDEQKCYLFEFLLCEERQKVTPHSSHPNRYLKNIQKFKSLYQFAQDLSTKIYLLNYAKENTKHGNKVRFMKLNNIRDDVSTDRIETENIETSIEKLKTQFRKKFCR